MRSWLVVASIALGVGSADAANLTFSFADVAGDGHSSGDLQGMRFHFDDATGDYSIELRAHPVQPFLGDFRINVNLFDPDTGTNDVNPAFFQDTNNEFNLASPATRVLLTGTNSRLISWQAGDRVAANHLPFGVPTGGGIFATGLMNLPQQGTFCASEQDCLGPLDATNFTTISELVTVFDNFDPGGGFHTSNSLVAATAFYNFFFTLSARAAARFTVTGGPYRLDSITLPIGFQGAVTAPVLRVRLTEDAGGAPGTTLEVLSENEDIWPSFVAPFDATTTLVSTANPQLVDGASYWIVTEPTAIPSGVAVDYRWSFNTSGAQVVARQQMQNPGLPPNPWPGQPVSLPLAFRVDGMLAECGDGADNDQDGLIDALDPGCAGPTDLSERDPTLVCDDGADNDGDGGIDHRPSGGGDPACQSPTSPREDAKCDDDVDNDGDGRIDWDGGNGAIADPECAGKAWRNSESPSCGLGAELALLLPALAALRRTRGLRPSRAKR